MKQNNIYLVGFMGSGKTSILKKIKQIVNANTIDLDENCLLYTSPSPRDLQGSRMPSSA